MENIFQTGTRVKAEETETQVRETSWDAAGLKTEGCAHFHIIKAGMIQRSLAWPCVGKT